MKKTLILLASLASLLLMSCGHSDSFKVEGTMADGSSINLRFIYYVNGGTLSGMTASTDGKFEFEGHSPEMTAVEVYDNDYRLLGRFVARNGDDIRLRLDRRNMYDNTMTGNDLNKQLTEFYNANSEKLSKGSVEERHKLIADYVGEHSANPLAMLLAATEIDASSESGKALADTVMGNISPEARVFTLAESFAELNTRVANETMRQPISAVTYKVKGNRVETYATQRSPLTVISISDATHGRDSVLEALRHLAKHEKKDRLKLLDLSVDVDTMAWVRSVKNDSASWTQGWAAGSISGQSLDKMGVPRVPYFILTDSAGSQLWRGGSATEIVSQAVERIQ